MDIDKQVVLVTGGSRGLGAAIVKAFAREGARVAVNYYSSKEKAEALASEWGEKAIAIQADVRNRAEVDALFSKAKEYFGAPITTIVNNALIQYFFDPVHRKDAAAIAWSDYLAQLEGSVQAAMNTVQAGLPLMKERKFGRIITIGKNIAQHPVVPYHDYTTAKAALLGFTRNMANELGADGITVNMVSGGLLKITDASKATTDEVFEAIKNSTPLRKVTAPEEVADAVLFFASPWARAVTGQNLLVDGGLVMK